MSGFDWAGLLRLGLRGLGLSPAAFWALTPAELTLMLGKAGGEGALSRARLDELARAFPDAPANPGADTGDTDDG